MLVVKCGDNFLVSGEMLRQHVVDVAEQRNIVTADDTGDTPYKGGETMRVKVRSV